MNRKKQKSIVWYLFQNRTNGIVLASQRFCTLYLLIWFNMFFFYFLNQLRRLNPSWFQSLWILANIINFNTLQQKYSGSSLVDPLNWCLYLFIFIDRVHNRECASGAEFIWLTAVHGRGVYYIINIGIGKWPLKTKTMHIVKIISKIFK